MNTILEKTITIAQQAGQKVAAIYHQQSQLVTHRKADNSFVTEADIQAHHFILQELSLLTPKIPIVSEEVATSSFQERQQWDQFWSIDPLDGTYEFVNRNGEFAVSIALIQKNYPILGVLYLPLLETTYFAAKDQGAFKMDAHGTIQKIQTHSITKDEPIRLVVSRRRNSSPELTAFLSQFRHYTILEHSSAYKLCIVAEGKADIYPRFGSTYEWDIAAGQCIVEEAGGAVLNLSGERLRYNDKESLKNPHFIAMGILHYPLDLMASQR